MISRGEFDGLEARVSRIESVLKISNIPLPTPSLSIPYTLVIEHEKSNTGERVNTSPFYNYLETDNHIFIKIYTHGKTLPTKSYTSVNKGFHEYLFVQNYYTVLIIKHSDVGSIGEHIWPKMNTMNTGNIHQYIDKYKRFGLFFGYSNVNEALKSDSLFSHGKGVFIIVNDHTNNNVQTYVKIHENELESVLVVGTGEIRVYKSKDITAEECVIKTPPPPPMPNSHEDGGGIITKTE